MAVSAAGRRNECKRLASPDKSPEREPSKLRGRVSSNDSLVLCRDCGKPYRFFFPFLSFLSFFSLPACRPFPFLSRRATRATRLPATPLEMGFRADGTTPVHITVYRGLVRRVAHLLINSVHCSFRAIRRRCSNPPTDARPVSFRGTLPARWTNSAPGLSGGLGMLSLACLRSG